MMWLKYGAMLVVAGLWTGVIYSKGYQAGKHEAESVCAHRQQLERETRERAYLTQIQSAERQIQQEAQKVRALNQALELQAIKNQKMRADYAHRLQSLQEVLRDNTSKNWGHHPVPKPVADWVLKLQREGEDRADHSISHTRLRHSPTAVQHLATDAD